MLEKALQQTRYLYPFQYRGNAATLDLPENIFPRATKPAWDHYAFRRHKFPKPECGETIIFYEDILAGSSPCSYILPRFALVRSIEESPTLNEAVNWLQQNSFVQIELDTLLTGVTELRKFKAVFAGLSPAYLRLTQNLPSIQSKSALFSL
jgi:hypothetical protein